MFSKDTSTCSRIGYAATLFGRWISVPHSVFAQLASAGLGKNRDFTTESETVPTVVVAPVSSGERVKQPSKTLESTLVFL